MKDDLDEDDEDAWPHHRSPLIYGAVFFLIGVVVAFGVGLLLHAATL